MSEKVKLDKNKVIVFMGSMNAMPMAYALELKKCGFEVMYFVDVPRKDILCRPENHFPDIDYPYPPWIVEWILPTQILLPLFPGLFAALYWRKIKQLTKKQVGCFILNGHFPSLAPYLPETASKIGLSHGSDLDVWANAESPEVLARTFRRSIFRYMPKVASKRLIKHIVGKQYQGYVHSDAIAYFPIGFSVGGDKVINRLMNSGVRYIPRYDASFEQLCGQPRGVRRPRKTLEIFSVVRFLFRTFPDGDEQCNKGNDLIIDGIARYFTKNKNIRVHFVEKGEDVRYAKELCRKLGLDQAVVWHREMPFKKLLELFVNSDICFDQVGSHWIGSGMYALWLGKPLIANPESAVRSGIWPIDNPVCAARTSEEVTEWLVKLENIDLCKELSKKSQAFVECYVSPMKTLNRLFDIDPQYQGLSQAD